jgi:regulator of RNase E activity RraA
VNAAVNSELLERFQEYTTANVSDVMDSMRVLDPGIRPVLPGGTMVGIAFTVRAYPGSILTVHKALTEASPGDVLVVDGEGDVRAGALFGEIMAKECLRRGYAGIVVDGAVRDVNGLIQEGFPVFARAVTPRVGTNRRLGATREVISCGGTVVHPGDIVIGDENGVVAIPRGKADDVLAALKALRIKEDRLVSAIEEGTYLAETLGLRDAFKDDKGA